MLNEQKKAEMLRRAERIYSLAEANGEKRYGRIIQHAIVQLADENNPAYLQALARMKRLPVTIDEFVESPDFLGGHMEVWEKLMPDIRAGNPDILAGDPTINEIILGGATGTGKTAYATVTNAYQLYNLLCFDWPQQLFGLSKATPIVFLFASVSSTVTNRVVYKPFRDLFLGMKFTERYIDYNRQLESALHIGQNIMVVPALASVQSMVGQAVIGGILDEVNFMARVENSKMVQGAQGQGGVYDQAELAYRNLSRRLKSRFTTRGPRPGALCVVSSTRYKGDFLDRRIDEVMTYGEEGTLVFRNKQYDVVPQTRFRGEKFRLLIGSDRWPTRILEEHEVAGKHYPREADVEFVPVEYKDEFLKDPEAALRDVVGIATDAIRPFITQRDRIVDCVNAARGARMRPLPVAHEVVLANENLPVLPSNFIPQDPGAPHFVHIDLATTSDRCGVSIVRHDGFVMQRGERLPRFSVVLALGIKPDSLHQLQIADLREWLLKLVSQYDLNLVQISYDGFQSKESIQVLRRAGIRATYVSVDRTPEPYEYLRDSIYDVRVLLPDSDLLRNELVQLEWFAHKNKVDHPPRGSKDVSDAVAGAIFAASRHPMVRQGIRALNADGEPVRTPNAMQRPSGSNRPSSKNRPKSSRDKLRNETLAAVDAPIPEPEPEADDPTVKQKLTVAPEETAE